MTPESVFAAAAELSGIAVEDLMQARWRPCPAWRRAVWGVLAREGWSQAGIGDITGHERSTVRDGLRHVDDDLLLELLRAVLRPRQDFPEIFPPTA